MGRISTAQQERDHHGLRDVCAACGHDFSPRNPEVLSHNGFRIHRSHTTDPTDGFYGKKQEG